MKLMQSTFPHIFLSIFHKTCFFWHILRVKWGGGVAGRGTGFEDFNVIQTFFWLNIFYFSVIV